MPSIHQIKSYFWLRIEIDFSLQPEGLRLLRLCAAASQHHQIQTGSGGHQGWFPHRLLVGPIQGQSRVEIRPVPRFAQFSFQPIHTLLRPFCLLTLVFVIFRFCSKRPSAREMPSGGKIWVPTEGRRSLRDAHSRRCDWHTSAEHLLQEKHLRFLGVWHRSKGDRHRRDLLLVRWSFGQAGGYIQWVCSNLRFFFFQDARW